MQYITDLWAGQPLLAVAAAMIFVAIMIALFGGRSLFRSRRNLSECRSLRKGDSQRTEQLAENIAKKVAEYLERKANGEVSEDRDIIPKIEVEEIPFDSIKDLRSPRLSGGRQKGAVLIVSMILLAVLTILGTGAMTMSTLQLKMATNTQNGAGIGHDFQEAEDGLATALDAFITTPDTFQADLDDGAPYPNGTAFTGAAWDIRPWSEDTFTRVSLATGIQNGATHHTFLKRVDVPVIIDGALSCYDGCDVDLVGNVEIDGQDNTPPVDFGCTGNSSACKPADDPFGEPPVSAIYMESGGSVTESGSVDKYGAAPLIKTGGGIFTADDWNAYVAVLIGFANAHNGDNWGTRDNPVIHHIDTDMAIVGNTKSAGILLVTAANVSFMADYYHEGLIIISNATGSNITMGGGFDVCGAIVATGPSVSIDVGGAGTPTVSFCSTALDNAARSSGIQSAGWFKE